MKKTILLLSAVLTLFTATAQTIGANAEGLLEKYQTSDVGLIKELGHIAITFPGGASGKYNYARKDVPGFGMRLDSIYSWNARYGKDENGEAAIDNDIRDYNTDKAEDRSYLYDLAEIQYQTGCEIIWKINVFSSPAEVIASVNDFLSIKVFDDLNWTPRVSYFDCGNELYFIDLNGDGQNMDGEIYIEMCIPYINELKSKFPLIPIALNYAQDVNNKAHRKFNDAVEEYINSNPGKISAVDPHPYLSDANDLGDACELHPSYNGYKQQLTRINYTSEFNSQLHEAFNLYNETWQNTTYYRSLFDTINKTMPGIKIITTEFQSNPITLWADVISNAAFLFYTFTEYRNEVEYFLAHNLLGSYDFAWIYNHGTSAKYYAAKLANELPLNYVDIPEDGKITIDSEGEHWFRYVNMTDEFIYVSINTTFESEVSVLNNGLWGLENYSTMGNANFYNKTPKQSVEVFTINSTDQEIKSNSFGYIKITVKKKEVECLKGCTNPTACNYNPDAICDDGSCVYKIRFLFFRYCPKIPVKLAPQTKF